MSLWQTALVKNSILAHFLAKAMASDLLALAYVRSSELPVKSTTAISG